VNQKDAGFSQPSRLLIVHGGIGNIHPPTILIKSSSLSADIGGIG